MQISESLLENKFLEIFDLIKKNNSVEVEFIQTAWIIRRCRKMLSQKNNKKDFQHSNLS